MGDIPIQELAQALGVASEQLIEWYVKRIPALWLSAGLACAGAFISGAICYRCLKLFRIAYEHCLNPNAELVAAGTAILGITAGAGLLLFSLSALFRINEAISATVAPEAYAVEAILKAL